MRKIEIYPKGSLLLRQGSYQRKAFIIEKGSVEVFQRDEKGNKTVLAIRGIKDIIGEMTLIEGGTRCATVVALEDCEVSILTLRRFQSLPDSHPGVKAIKKIMNERNNK